MVKKTSTPKAVSSSPSAPTAASLVVERTQTGVRIEKRILKVLKALAELTDLSLGDLLEGIVLHVFEGKVPFQGETLHKIAELKRIYGLDLDASASHQLKESAVEDEAEGGKRERRPPEPRGKARSR